MERLNVNDMVYDALNYNEGVIVDVKDNTIVYRDNNFNTTIIDDKYAYMIDVDLSNKHNITICIEHNQTNGDYPYYIPIANENCYEDELNDFSSF